MSKRLGYARQGVAVVIGPISLIELPTVTGRLSNGMALGVRLDEKDVIEFRWARQDTHLHLEAVAGAIGWNDW